MAQPTVVDAMRKMYEEGVNKVAREQTAAATESLATQFLVSKVEEYAAMAVVTHYVAAGVFAGVLTLAVFLWCFCSFTLRSLVVGTILLILVAFSAYFLGMYSMTGAA